VSNKVACADQPAGLRQQWDTEDLSFALTAVCCSLFFHAIPTGSSKRYLVREAAASGIEAGKSPVFMDLMRELRLAPQVHCQEREEKPNPPVSQSLTGWPAEKDRTKIMHRFGLVLTAAAALAVMGATGCATKKYVRNQTAPLIEHEGQLDGKTAENSRQIQDVDARSQAGIRQAQGAADAAGQSAQNASRQAADALAMANSAVHRADSLASVVKGLDDYKPVANVSVTFGFNQAALTKEDREQLDSFAAQLTSAKGFILEVTGGTDSAGSSEYNYELSQRRANAVVRYLASKYGIPAHRFYLIGIGKDKQVAPNKTAAGRKQNRRVEVQLLSNVGIAAAQAGVQ
jgi:outer membrane protein OmpA-like peptidoglycan-associated protein